MIILQQATLCGKASRVTTKPVVGVGTYNVECRPLLHKRLCFRPAR